MEGSEDRLTSISGATTIEEMADFWDTHSVADYWDQTEEVHFTFGFGRRHRVAVDPDVFDKVADYARGRGLGPETVINLWLAEKVSALASAACREPAGATEPAKAPECEPANVAQ